MILATLGKLCVADALTVTTQISDNVIQLPAVDYAAMTDVWLVITTKTVVTNSGTTFTLDLVMAQEAGLSNVIVVVRIYMADETDLRITTLNRRICAINVGKMLKDMLETSGSDYPFIGLKMVLSGGTATLGIDASLSFTEPPTLHHRMQIDSNVTVASVASDDSGSVVP